MAAKKEQAHLPKPTGQEVWRLRLYVAGQNARTAFALANLKEICAQYLPGRYHLQVIDIRQQPAMARADQIVAIPTLVRTFPQPVRRFLGDLSDLERAVATLKLQPA